MIKILTLCSLVACTIYTSQAPQPQINPSPSNAAQALIQSVVHAQISQAEKKSPQPAMPAVTTKKSESKKKINGNWIPPIMIPRDE